MLTDHVWSSTRYAPTPRDQYVAVKTRGMLASVYTIALWSEGLKCFAAHRYMTSELLSEHQITFWARATYKDVESVHTLSNLHVSALPRRASTYSLHNKIWGR